ncbi:cation diffusion facilitator family transporter [Ferrimicrobium sp.]|uniref:cation diffusion facilitator family transporter n=1 Tax=Ferrimicrobium sp. TaxID=2926050 RepID=UPI0026246933|nr:cation diffusion facilitator family transporter [Ferrimicrobium sp.]
MTQAHDHHAFTATAGSRNRGRLKFVLGISLTVLAAEVVGGLLGHSLALLADAGHVATDVAGIGLSLLGIWFGRRPSNDARTFGYQRAEIFAAVINAVLLFGVGIFIIVEAIVRLIHPEVASAGIMTIFGVVALVGNGMSLVILRPGQGESLNIRGAFLETLSDLLGAIAVLIAAALIAATGFERADALASLLIGILILPRTMKLLRETVDVLLEATPKDINMAEVRDHIKSTPGVLAVHDLHVWTITSGNPVLSAHVVIEDIVFDRGGAATILDELGECLSGHFDVEHCTFQLEPARHQLHEPTTHQ